LIIDTLTINSLPFIHYKRFFSEPLGGNIVSASVFYFCTRLRCLSITHSPKGHQKGKGKAGVAKTPTKSCVMDSGGNIVVTVDMKSTDHTVEQQTVKALLAIKQNVRL